MVAFGYAIKSHTERHRYIRACETTAVALREREHLGGIYSKTRWVPPDADKKETNCKGDHGWFANKNKSKRV